MHTIHAWTEQTALAFNYGKALQRLRDCSSNAATENNSQANSNVVAWQDIRNLTPVNDYLWFDSSCRTFDQGHAWANQTLLWAVRAGAPAVTAYCADVLTLPSACMIFEMPIQVAHYLFHQIPRTFHWTEVKVLLVKRGHLTFTVKNFHNIILRAYFCFLSYKFSNPCPTSMGCLNHPLTKETIAKCTTSSKYHKNLSLKIQALLTAHEVHETAISMQRSRFPTLPCVPVIALLCEV